jgi:hypothetical protein
MGAILAAGLSSGLGPGALLGGGEALAAGAGRAQIADAIHPVFVLGLPLMALAMAFVLMIPERPLRRSVREQEHPPSLEKPAALDRSAA